MKKVTFKLKACNWPARKTTLILRGEKPNGDVLVKHNGCDDFIVRKNEIISIQEVKNG